MISLAAPLVPTLRAPHRGASISGGRSLGLFATPMTAPQRARLPVCVSTMRLSRSSISHRASQTTRATYSWSPQRQSHEVLKYSWATVQSIGVPVATRLPRHPHQGLRLVGGGEWACMVGGMGGLLTRDAAQQGTLERSTQVQCQRNTFGRPPNL